MGKAHAAKRDFDSAFQYLRQALQASAGDAGVVQEIRRTKELEKAHKQRQRYAFAKLFSGGLS